MVEIVGTWELVRAIAVAADGTELPRPFGGEKAMGRVTFNADGRMMAVMCDGRTELPGGEEREYISYCGNYTFDGSRLVTRCDASADPARIGTDQVRDVSFDGDLMVLRPPMKPYGARVEQRELAWRKIAET
jgi:hypothetical protein